MSAPPAPAPGAGDKSAPAPQTAACAPPDRAAQWEQDLRDVLAGLEACEQQMRQARRAACRADSEAFSGKCGAVLESIAALQLFASKFLLEQPPEGACAGARHARVLAGAEWFRDLAQTIRAARDVLSRSQDQLASSAARKQADDIRRTTVADPAAAQEAEAGGEAAAGEEAAAGAAAAAAEATASPRGDLPALLTDALNPGGGPRQEDLLAILQRRHAIALDLRQAELATATSLRACAAGAGEWACAASGELKRAMCAQDDAMMRVATHAATQLEAQGVGAMEHVDKLLRGEEEGGVRATLAWLTRAKVAYDEAYAIKAFPTQLAPKLPPLDLPKVPVRAAGCGLRAAGFALPASRCRLRACTGRRAASCVQAGPDKCAGAAVHAVMDCACGGGSSGRRVTQAPQRPTWWRWRSAWAP